MRKVVKSIIIVLLVGISLFLQKNKNENKKIIKNKADNIPPYFLSKIASKPLVKNLDGNRLKLFN